MTNELNYKTDVIELIFASRNKEYGSYNLRQSYKTYLTVAMWIAIFIVIVGTTVYRMSNPEVAVITDKDGSTVTTTILSNVPPIEQNLDMPKTKVQPKVPTIKFTPPVVRPDEIVKNEYIPTIEELKDVNPGLETVKGSEDGYIVLDDEEVATDIEEVKKPVEFYTWAEEMPEPIGGVTGIMKNVVYPEIAKRAEVQGRVVVLAFVDESGSVTKAEIVKSIGAGCDEAALDAVLKTKFKPGKQNGNPVKVQVLIPIVFKLQ